ncbi:MAG TPA: lamin tail domain-containing protein [Pyrinomonadaceae bacterium]|jgi:hypothetical protein
MSPFSRACRRVFVALAFVLFLSAFEQVFAVSPNVVISQIYGGGGAASPNFKCDYIELFNRGRTTVNLSNWAVQYAAAGSTSAFTKTNLQGSIAPGRYYLIQQSCAGSGGGADLPTPDVVGTTPMAATQGKVALTSDQTTLAAGCPVSASIVDFVSYGTNNCAEGGAGTTPDLSATTAAFRKQNGAQDTDNNAADFINAAPAPRNSASPMTILPGFLIINEFRLRGPGTGTATQAFDEFVEIYNATDQFIFVQTNDNSSGYALAASDGILRFTIPNGTGFVPRGHFLGVNSVGYSLAAYPAASNTTATGDTAYTIDIPDNRGIALFNTADPTRFSTATRLDAVGFETNGATVGEINPLYKEGTGHPAINPNFNTNYSFYRNLLSGLPKDSDNNSVDFIIVDPSGTPYTPPGAPNVIPQRLGAPGPSNSSSPTIQNTTAVAINYLDTTVSPTLAPNRERGASVEGCPSEFGTLRVRRRFTNYTGSPITKLRFRIIDITTFPPPPGAADVRVCTSEDARVTTNDSGICATTAGASSTTAPCTIPVGRTTLEEPPAQPDGGGFNSSVAAGTITLANPLPHGAGIDLQFLLGVAGKGSFRFFIDIESRH